MRNPTLNRMYDDFADLWPLISRPEAYAKEAGYWRDALRSELGPGRHEILELGVGGGHNLSHLIKEFAATGSDISEKMLAQCRKLNPDVPLHVGDMRTLRLDQRFKAVLIHDAIGYMLTESDLTQTFVTAAEHLEPGGVLVVAPDHVRETFSSPRVEHSTISDGQTELTLIEYQYDPDPDDTTTETRMLYFVRTEEGLRVEEDRHVFGLFPRQTWLDLMQDTGFTVREVPYPVHDDGREAYLLIGRWKGPHNKPDARDGR